MGAKKKPPPPPKQRIPPLLLAALTILALAAFALLPRVAQSVRLQWSFLGAAAALLIFLLALARSVARSGRTLSYRFLAVKSHYVQLFMHAGIYAYWGMYWPEVYAHIPLILGQVVFLYALDMLVCWSRRDRWMLGYGPIPIIFSMNLFLWFRDDWFWLQFAMIATGVLFKEFVKWDRFGRRTHIFNPSAIALFLFSIGLLATHATQITWGPEIAQTLHLPPYIYLEIFALGLVVQGLFSVTLMTLSAAAALYALNLVFTHFTGVYHFVDSNIPVSVFIGLHLLVTDPATSPRNNTAKIVFGGLYGTAVFALFGLLGAFSAPQFYDKLLCVPLLNLSVRALDRWGEAFSARFHPLNFGERWGARNLNLAHMGIWAALFTVMLATGFVGYHHPGQSLTFWQQACAQGRYNSCRTWAHALLTACEGNQAAACLEHGRLTEEGRVVPRDRLTAGKSLGHACDMGLSAGCVELARFADDGGSGILDRACGDRGDEVACYVSGSLAWHARDAARATALFEKACAQGFWRGCGRLGQIYLSGRGTARSPALAQRYFDKACNAGDPSSCYTEALLYLRGQGVARSEPLAEDRMSKACALGMRAACQLADPSFTPLSARE